MTKNINKYLSNYAEDEIIALSDFPTDKKFQHVVIIPAYKESFTFIERFFSSTLAQQNALVIVIINQPDSEIDQQMQQALYHSCLKLGKLNWQKQQLSLLELANGNSSLLLVDRFSLPIPAQQGVGLARKIGADLALALINKGNINTRWLYSTDADAHLPDNYFSSLQHLTQGDVLACFDFYHYSSEKNIHAANDLYEQALRYYVAGLIYANSPYAFFTIGSILAFDINAYAAVRGFPKRSAGEDFYLMNKLAKLGDVAFIEACQLKIEARTSDRVPFGTGPAVREILALQANNKCYCYYHPQAFEYLKQLLIEFSSLWQHRQQLDVWYQQQPKIVSDSLKSIGLTSFVNKQVNAKESQFVKQIPIWFDAFKTLKFIHALRALGIADIALHKAIDQAVFT
jgi:hypothetical protein